MFLNLPFSHKVRISHEQNNNCLGESGECTRYAKFETLNFKLESEAEGITHKKIICRLMVTNKFLLFYSPKPCLSWTQVWILIYRNWPAGWTSFALLLHNAQHKIPYMAVPVVWWWCCDGYQTGWTNQQQQKSKNNFKERTRIPKINNGEIIFWSLNVH